MAIRDLPREIQKIMNNIILMAEIMGDLQTRYVQDNQTQICEFIVQFPGYKEDDPQSTIKVSLWGKSAPRAPEFYHNGDRVIIEGSLRMNTVERQEGFKEKRAELNAFRIYSLSGEELSAPIGDQGIGAPEPAAGIPQPMASQKAAIPKTVSKAAPTKPPSMPSRQNDSLRDSPSGIDLDDIPF